MEEPTLPFFSATVIPKQFCRAHTDVGDTDVQQIVGSIMVGHVLRSEAAVEAWCLDFNGVSPPLASDRSVSEAAWVPDGCEDGDGDIFRLIGDDESAAARMIVLWPCGSRKARKSAVVGAEVA